MSNCALMSLFSAVIRGVLKGVMLSVFVLDCFSDISYPQACGDEVFFDIQHLDFCACICLTYLVGASYRILHGEHVPVIRPLVFCLRLTCLAFILRYPAFRFFTSSRPLFFSRRVLRFVVSKIARSFDLQVFYRIPVWGP